MNNIAIGLLIANVVGTIIFWTRDKHLLYALYSVSILAFFVLTVYEDYTPEWKDYQRQYVKLLIEKESDAKKKEDLSNFPIAIKQIWNKELKIADRCTTCHLGVDNPDMADARQPFKYHPVAHVKDDGMIIHDFNEIGCTMCHQGQGLATTEHLAHAFHVPHWELPMYPIGKEGMVQASCPACHDELSAPKDYRLLKGAEMITDSREFAEGDNDMEIECRECHTYYGIGEVLAPDLTAFGEKTAHEFEATHIMNYVEGDKTKYEWTLQHFLNPQKITPDDEELGMEETIMPNFEMSREQAHKLTVWVFSMKESAVPVKYRYRPAAPPTSSKPSVAEQIAGLYTPEEFAALSKGEKLFLRTNCWICHTIRGKGGKLGPDLTKVGKKRDEAWMLKHFKDPRSVTQKSFMPKFNLSDEQMHELVVYLQTLR